MLLVMLILVMGGLLSHKATTSLSIKDSVDNGFFYLNAPAALGVPSLESSLSSLLEAKQALLAYSVTYADNYPASGAGPGHLPCPDRSPINDNNEFNDGPNPPCAGDDENLGRFPRFTFVQGQSDLPSLIKLIDFYYESSLQDRRLWYVVSPAYINNPINRKVNIGTKGQLSVDGVENVVAIVLDPGPDIGSHYGGRPNDIVTAYLEGENADKDRIFSHYSDNKHNDKLVYITQSELNRVVFPRILQFAKDWLDEHKNRHCGVDRFNCYPDAGDVLGNCQPNRHDGYLPFFQDQCSSSLLVNGKIDGIDYSKHWFFRNEWLRFVRYRLDPVCKTPQGSQCEVATIINSEYPERSYLHVKPRMEAA